MRDLFVMDKKDYRPDGQVFRRPSARAVIERDGKILMIYSQKYDYYKLPGGGIHPSETPKEALVREVREESGYQILADSITEYGRVLRRRRDSMVADGIFEQENFYYFCKVADERAEVCLDDYEAEEGFTPVWIEPLEASRHNRACQNGPDEEMLVREAMVLERIAVEWESGMEKRNRKME